MTPLERLTFETKLESLKTQELHESRDYTLTYYRNDGTAENPNWSQLSAAPIAVGEYKVVITGMGNYTNAVEKTFSVVAAGKQLTVEIPDNQVTYKADAYRPKVTVKTEGRRGPQQQQLHHDLQLHRHHRQNGDGERDICQRFHGVYQRGYLHHPRQRHGELCGGVRSGDLYGEGQGFGGRG